ncbi:MAG: phosphoadenosine phosphosulfate reductase family protein, partial [Verrucomicrobiota bacterium]
MSVTAPTTLDLPALNAEFADLGYEDRFHMLRERLPDRQFVVSTSAGAQASVMLHLVTKALPEAPIVFIDTGYHFAETYQYLDELKERFDANIHIYSPLITAARQEAL